MFLIYESIFNRTPWRGALAPRFFIKVSEDFQRLLPIIHPLPLIVFFILKALLQPTLASSIKLDTEHYCLDTNSKVSLAVTNTPSFLQGYCPQ